MQLKPSEIFTVVRQLGDPLDTGTYYVQAKIRNAETDELLETLNLTNSGGQRFRSNWTVPADTSGEGFYIDIETIVYTDSGYTSVSDVYQRENAVYLVQDRQTAPFHGGGGVEVDYGKIEKIVAKPVKQVKKVVRGKSVDIKPVEEMLEEILAGVTEIKNKEVADHTGVLKDIASMIGEARTAITEQIEARPKFEKTDLTQLNATLETVGNGIASLGEKVGEAFKTVDGMTKTIKEGMLSIRKAVNGMILRFNKAPFLMMLPQEAATGRMDTIEEDVEDDKPTVPARKRLTFDEKGGKNGAQGGFVTIGALVAMMLITAGAVSGLTAYRSMSAPAQVVEESSEDLQLGDSVNSLPQFTSTTSPTAITQRSYGKAIKITGLSDGCLSLSSSLLTSSGVACGSGGGGGSGGGPFSTTTNSLGIYNNVGDQLLLTDDNRTSTSSSGILELERDAATTTIAFKATAINPTYRFGLDFIESGSSPSSAWLYDGSGTGDDNKIGLYDYTTGTMDFFINKGGGFLATGSSTVNNRLNLGDIVHFTGTSTVAYSEGNLYYNSSEDAFEGHNSEAEIELKISENNFVRVRNNTGATLTKGMPVYVTGATGNRANVAKAQANADAGGGDLVAIGLAAHDIENNSDGYVITLGRLENIDTSAWTAGDELFLGTTTAGTLTNLLPLSPDWVVPIGYVLTSDPSTGTILVDLHAWYDTIDLTAEARNQDVTGYWTFVNTRTTNASSTNATTTNLHITSLNCTGNANGGALTADANGLISCSDDDSSAGGGTFSFTPTTYNGQTVNSTTTGLWLRGSPLSLVASSTFATNATTTNATTTSLAVTGDRITISANPFIRSGAHNLTLTTTGTTNVTLPTTGTLATLENTQTFTGAKTFSALTTLANASTTDVSASGTFFGKDGSASAPSYTFTTDTDTGIYGGGALNFTVNGTLSIQQTAAGIFPQLGIYSAQAGTASDANFSFSGDADTGMYRIGANVLGFTAGGGERLRLSSSGATTTGGFAVTALNASNCDLKADTSGNFYCGTDATGGGGSSFGQVFELTTPSMIAATTTTKGLLLGRTTLLTGENCVLCVHATSTAGNLFFASTTNGFSGNIFKFDTSTGAEIASLDSSGFFFANDGIQANTSLTAGTDLTVNGSNFQFGSSGVQFTTDQDGALTIQSLGNGTTEDLTINLDDTSNVISLTSSTGVTRLDYGTLGITTTGLIDVSGGTLKVPAAANPTISSSATLAIDTTAASSSLRYYDGTAERFVYDIRSKGLFVASSTPGQSGNKFGASATSTFTIWNPDHSATLTSFYCKTDTGTVRVRFGDGTNWTSDVSCTSSGTSATPGSNNTFTLREDVQVQIGTAASSPNKVTISSEWRMGD